jgi:hypothetical protein
VLESKNVAFHNTHVVPGGQNFEFGDVTRPKPSIGNIHDLPTERELLLCEAKPVGGQDSVGMSHTRIANEIQAILNKTLSNSLCVQLCRCDATRPLPDRFHWPTKRCLELLRAEGKQQRKNWVAEQTGFDNVGTRKAKVRQFDLECSVIPKRERDGFFVANPIPQYDIWSNTFVCVAQHVPHAIVDGPGDFGNPRRRGTDRAANSQS